MSIKLFFKELIHEVFVKPILKKSDNKLLDYLLLNNNKPVIIASTGRAGSTLLFHAVAKGIYKSKLSQKYSERPLFSSDGISKLKKGRVYKTHLPYEYFESVDADVVFIYDDYINTLKSYKQCLDKYGLDWCSQHLKNLCSAYDVKFCGEQYDILNYEHQMKSWNGSNVSNVTIVEFSDLWNINFKEKIGIDIDIPRKRERQSLNIKINETPFVKKLNSIFENISSSR